MKKAKKSKSAAKRPTIPKGYHSVTPYLSVDGASEALEFYKRAFGAKVIMVMPGAKGKIGHAEVQIGDSRVMLADEHPEMNFTGPQSRGGSTVHLHVYVGNADAMAARAIKAGAKLVRAVEDQFYGDRLGTIEDPFGHVWHLATNKENVPLGEMKKRAQKKAKESER
jgi:PhnB protein